MKSEDEMIPNPAEPLAPNDDPLDRQYREYLEQEERRKQQMRESAEFEQELWEAEKERVRKSREERLRRLLIVMSIVAVGTLFIFADQQKVSIVQFVFEHWQALVGAFLAFIPSLYIIAPGVFSQISFRDVDLRRRIEQASSGKSPAAAWPFPTQLDSERFMESSESDQGPSTGFERYFAQIARRFDERASDAEEKASLLLDKGTTLTFVGIVFFVFSIVAWQVMAWIHGFRTEFVYGIASCSALFIFIEVLSGWYLKQYRQYVDTATYLLKIKSIFDKFMLAYMASETLSRRANIHEYNGYEILLSMLAKDIRWPDSYLIRKAEANFALETLDGIKALTEALRKKKTKKRPEKKPEE